MHQLNNSTPVYEFVIRNFIPVLPAEAFFSKKNANLMLDDYYENLQRKNKETGKYEEILNPFPYSRATFSCALTESNDLAVGYMVHTGYSFNGREMRRNPFNKKVGRQGARSRLQNLLQTGKTTHYSHIIHQGELNHFIDSIITYNSAKNYNNNSEIKPFMLHSSEFNNRIDNSLFMITGLDIFSSEKKINEIINSITETLRKQLIAAATNLSAMKVTAS